MAQLKETGGGREGCVTLKLSSSLPHTHLLCSWLGLFRRHLHTDNFPTLKYLNTCLGVQ